MRARKHDVVRTCMHAQCMHPQSHVRSRSDPRRHRRRGPCLIAFITATRHLNASCKINRHFYPQSARLATVATRLWRRSSPTAFVGKTFVVLQLERQEDWFRCFTHAAGIPHAAVTSGWGDVRTVDCKQAALAGSKSSPEAHARDPREDCYWHPPGSSCGAFARRPFGPTPTTGELRGGNATAVRPVPVGSSTGHDSLLPHKTATSDAVVPHEAAASSSGSDLEQATVNQHHTTDSASKVGEFYDADTTRLVHEAFKADFELLRFTHAD